MRDPRFTTTLAIALLSLVSVCAAAENGETAASRPRVPVDRSLPPEPNAVFTCFINEVKAANWDKALEYCSAKVRTKAAEYDSAEAFFNTVLPINKVIALAKFENRGASLLNNTPIRYDCEIQLKDPDYRYPLRWHLALLRENTNWVMDFPTKQLHIWIKHAMLISKTSNQELEVDYERNRAGLEVHLVPLSDQFIIGRPMMFRLELKNISTETLFYDNSSYMVNDPIIIKGPDDTSVPYVDTSYQTGGIEECIEPNETITLVERYDVRSQYHIVKPGKYSFQFKNANWSTPMSTVVEMDVNDGPLSPLEESVEAIRTVLPQGWGLTRRLMSADEWMAPLPPDETISVHLMGACPPKASSGFVSAISIYIFSGPEAADSFLNSSANVDFRGTSHLGTVLIRSINAQDLWPDYREQLIKALQIDVQSVRTETAEINETID